MLITAGTAAVAVGLRHTMYRKAYSNLFIYIYGELKSFFRIVKCKTMQVE